MFQFDSRKIYCIGADLGLAGDPVYGDFTEWQQEQPIELWFKPLGKPKRLITRAGAGSGAAGPSRGVSGGVRQHLCISRALFRPGGTVKGPILA